MYDQRHHTHHRRGNVQLVRNGDAVNVRASECISSRPLEDTEKADAIAE